MIIDCHQHPNWQGKNVDQIVANMDEYGIDKAWLLSWELPAQDYDCANVPAFDPRRMGIPLDDVLHACEKYPQRFIPGHTVDPHQPDAFERMDAAIRMYGIRVFGEFKRRIVLDDPDAILLFRQCGIWGLPVLLHIDAPAPVRPTPPQRDYWYCADIDRLQTVLKLCPDTNFIGHAPGFWRHISGDGATAAGAYPAGPVTPGGRVPALLAAHKNLYADISAGSGLNAISRPPADHARRFLTEFQDQVLFGRDGFDNRQLEFLKRQNLPAPVWEKITGQNAARLIRA